MAEVGTYYITIMPSMKGFTSSVKSQLGGLGTTGGKDYSKGFMSVLKGSALGTVLGGLATQAGSSIMGGLRTGIGRLDTIKNFPKVMKGLGFETGEADAAIQEIMDHLDGLPTATQDMVTLTQAISDSTGDLTLATKAALGFNDMMLANGASTEEMYIAQGVLNRVLGKGSATTAQWGSLMAVMPAQLGQVARHMLGAEASSEDLHAALEDGTVSWNDFLKAIVELDEKGTGSMDSFSQQARNNAVGIGTALTNVTNRIGAGWAEIINQIGQTNISGAIDKMSYGIRETMYKIADGVGYLRDKIADAKIFENAGKVIGSIGEAISTNFSGATDIVKSVADALVSLTGGALQWLADHGEFVKAAVMGIAGAFATLIGFNIGVKLAALPGIFTAIQTALSANQFVIILTVIGALSAALYAFFTQTETGQQVLSTLSTVLSNIAGVISGAVSSAFNVLTGLITGAVRMWKTFSETLKMVQQGIKKAVVNTWTSLKATVTNIVTGLATGISTKWTEIKTATATKWNEVKSSVTGKLTELKSAAGAKLTELKAAVSTKWAEVKTNTAAKWGEIKSSISTKLTSIKSSVSSGLASVKSVASSAWNSIKSTAVSKWESLRSSIASKINAIKGLFPINVGNILSGIRTPHFGINWTTKTILGKSISWPSGVSVSWYKKGGIFDNPALIGIGEGGREAALPLNRKSYGEIARGIAMAGVGGGDVIVTGNEFIVREEADIDRIADRIAQKIRRERGAAA